MSLAVSAEHRRRHPDARAAGPRRRHRRGQRGFSLLETLVALALLALVLVMGLELLWRLPRYELQLQAQLDATRAMERALESVRAGAIPLVSGELPDPTLTLGGNDAAGDLALTLEVEATATPSLYDVAVEARYFVLGRTERRQIETRVWQP